MTKKKASTKPAANRTRPRRDQTTAESVSPKERKQFAHNAPVRRAASKARE